MIIKIGMPDSRWRATLQGDPCGLEGMGNTENEAVGDLIFQLASANDADSATEEVDVRIIAE